VAAANVRPKGPKVERLELRRFPRATDGKRPTKSHQGTNATTNTANYGLGEHGLGDVRRFLFQRHSKLWAALDREVRQRSGRAQQHDEENSQYNTAKPATVNQCVPQRNQLPLLQVLHDGRINGRRTNITDLTELFTGSVHN
jgi:hypothetical protein